MDSLYLIKSIAVNVFAPLTIILILLIFACIRVAKLTAHRDLKFAVYGATIFLALVSSPILTNTLLRPLEQSTPVYRDNLATVDNIVLLGCYNRFDQNRPVLDNMHDCSKSRMVEVLRLAQVYPQAHIFTSGYHKAQYELSHAQFMRQALIALGIDKSRVTAITGSRNTEAESKLLKSYLLDKVNLLVTDAAHLERAIYLFQKEKIKVIGVPARYLTVSELDLKISLLAPQTSAVEKVERFFYEKTGRLWLWLNDI